jgi:hypothetical protein
MGRTVVWEAGHVVQDMPTEAHARCCTAIVKVRHLGAIIGMVHTCRSSAIMTRQNLSAAFVMTGALRATSVAPSRSSA